MGKHEQSVFRPADLRRAVTEWVAQGFHVRVGADGSIDVKPAEQTSKDEFDLVDMKR
ncbi:hypothetical protein [Thioclava sp. GXIMD4215]|uniref:hypothetical protein n=1 Tax=Thioclava sp. GXIMD4215 TaxID=3131928 RepID=UPI00324C27F5